MDSEGVGGQVQASGDKAMNDRYIVTTDGYGVTMFAGEDGGISVLNVRSSLEDICCELNSVCEMYEDKIANKDARIKELESQTETLKATIGGYVKAGESLVKERDRYKKASLLSRQSISAMLRVWEYRDKEAFVSNAGDELRAVVSLLDEALGGE